MRKRCHCPSSSVSTWPGGRGSGLRVMVRPPAHKQITAREAHAGALPLRLQRAVIPVGQAVPSRDAPSARTTHLQWNPTPNQARTQSAPRPARNAIGPDYLRNAPEAAARVVQLADPDRGWDAIVIGDRLRGSSPRSERGSPRRRLRTPSRRYAASDTGTRRSSAGPSGSRHPCSGSGAPPACCSPPYASDRQATASALMECDEVEEGLEVQAACAVGVGREEPPEAAWRRRTKVLAGEQPAKVDV